MAYAESDGFNHDGGRSHEWKCELLEGLDAKQHHGWEGWGSCRRRVGACGLSGDVGTDERESSLGGRGRLSGGEGGVEGCE